MTEGPLSGISILEFEAIGPVPFAVAHLGDMGATVTRVTRPGGHSNLPVALDATTRAVGSVVELDLKTPQGTEAALELAAQADVLVEGYRPGTMERLGLGPDDVRERSPAVVYARVTGWGQEGPYASMAGHDINYIGLTGVLHAIGSSTEPIPPLNMVGDYGGGAMFAVSGILAALVERQQTGRGRTIDIAMVDGSAALLAPIRAMLDGGVWLDRRETNLLDGGAPFYRTYETSDGRFVAVGALEPAFYASLLEGLGLTEADLPDRYQVANWAELARIFADRFASRSRTEWQAVFDGTDACVTPVLSMAEVMSHPHNSSRGAIVADDRGERPAPAPRFSM